MKTRMVVQTALIAALYAALTIALPLQYGAIQFRIAEMLTLLCFYDKKYCPALILGCFAANLASTLGPIDWVVGTAATALSVLPMSRVKSIYAAALFPVIVNGLIIGIELKIVFGTPLFAGMGTVALGEAAVMAAGVAAFKTFRLLRKAG